MDCLILIDGLWHIGRPGVAAKWNEDEKRPAPALGWFTRDGALICFAGEEVVATFLPEIN